MLLYIYHCYATVTAKPNAKLWTLPCSSSTDPSSVNEINCSSSGENLTATLMYKNTRDNYWYRVTKNNRTYYLYAGNVTNVSLRWDVSANNISAPSSITQGSYYSLQGTISTSYLKLCFVSSYVYNGSATSGTPATGGEVNINAASYSLYNSTLDTMTQFNVLSPGSYTLVFRARATNNYSENGTTMQTYTRPLSDSIVYTKQFTVTSPAPTSYDLTLSSHYVYKYVNDSTPTVVACSYTASKEELKGLTISYSIGDTSVCYCSWGGWNGNVDNLSIYSNGIGSTTVTVTFKNTDSGQIYDTEYITVVIDGDPWIDSTLTELSTDDQDTSTYETMIYCGGYLPDSYWFYWNVYDTSICTASWGDWDGPTQCPLYITPTGTAGSTTVRVDLIDGSTSEPITSVYISVNVDPSITLNEALNYEGSIDFSTSSAYPFYVENVDGFPSGVSSNGGVANSESYITARVLLRPCDSISFYYICSTEENFDLLKFYANDELVFQTSGESNGWQYYSFSPQTSGYCTLKWCYTKDGSVNSGNDRIVIDDVSVTNGDFTPDDLNSALNIGYTETYVRLRFSNEGLFYSDDWYDDKVGSSFNFGNADSVAAVETSVYLEEGDELWYSYYYSTESNFDWFNVYMNGEQYVHESGESYGWNTNYFYAPYSGAYTFRWEYTKDGSVNGGMDCIKLDNIYISRANYVSLDEALNADGSYLHFTTGSEYPFYPYHLFGTNAVGSYCGSSSNFGFDDTISYVETEAYLDIGDALEFTFMCRSEESFDMVNFYVNGELLYQHSGIDENWNVITYTAENEYESGYCVFRWEFSKDSSVNVDFDAVFISNIHLIEYEPDYIPGDVDGNGSVTVSDAIMALRAAMGIVSLSDDQIMRGDVDGSGSITVSDAIMILRAAMGILQLSIVPTTAADGITIGILPEPDEKVQVINKSR